MYGKIKLFCIIHLSQILYLNKPFKYYITSIQFWRKKFTYYTHNQISEICSQRVAHISWSPQNDPLGLFLLILIEVVCVLILWTLQNLLKILRIFPKIVNTQIKVVFELRLRSRWKFSIFNLEKCFFLV